MNYRRCNHPHPRIAKGRATNGSWQVVWWCDDCGGRARPESVSHKKAPPLDRLDVVFDYTGDPCERCGRTDGVEAHHWAPRHLFGPDADTWPMGMLCLSCHKEWHRIVTPNMADQQGEYSKWVNSEPNEDMVVTDYDEWERQEYEKWLDEQERGEAA